MKLSITTFQLICSLWNYPQEVLEDKDYLNRALDYIITGDLNFTAQEKETAKEEIKQLIKTL